MELRDILKNLRSDKALSQRELAKILNVSPSTIAMYETGKRAPDTDTIEIFADYYKVSVDYLLGRTDSQRIIDKFSYKEIPPTPSARIRIIQRKIVELSEESLTFLEFQLERLREFDQEAVNRRKGERDSILGVPTNRPQ